MCVLPKSIQSVLYKYNSQILKLNLKRKGRRHNGTPNAMLVRYLCSAVVLLLETREGEGVCRFQVLSGNYTFTDN